MAEAPWIISDPLWQRIEPLLPKKERRARYPGRKRLPDREALQGILFVLSTGIAWGQLPAELGFGSGVTCWRRLEEWQQAGVWQRLHALLWPSCVGPASWSGRGRWWTAATCRRKRGRENRPEPGRPRPAGQQASPPRRCDGGPARLHRDRRQPQRHHPADPAGRGRASGAWPARPAAATAPADRRRPRLRPRALPP